MMRELYFLKQAEEENQEIFFSEYPGSDFQVVKMKEKPVYLLRNKKDQKSWVVSILGVASFDKIQEALNSFFGLVKVSSMKFIRKSTYKRVASLPMNKKASFLKEAISYANDAWIDDPENLVHSANTELWSITQSGKYVARLFEDTDEPLDI